VSDDITVKVNHTGLMDALLAAQGEAPKIQKDALNPHFKSKYMSLDKIIGEVGPVLSKHGLIWVTLPCRDEKGDPALRYRMIHAASKEELGDTIPLLLSKSDPQGQGSAITYARRYSLVAVLNLVADEDDDGNSASPTPTTTRASNGGARVSAAPPQQTEQLATAKQRGLINVRASEKGLPPIVLAGIVNTAGKGEPIDFDSQSDADAWLKRALDRLPGRLVNPILKAIDQAKTEAEA
jgi:hypothetical protein